MNDSTIPWFVVVVGLVPGILMIASALPLYFRRVRPNWIYGVRMPSTLADETVWYDINARGGRDLMVLGVAYLVLESFSLGFGGSWPMELRILGPVIVVVLALVVEVVVLAQFARKLLKQRRSDILPSRIFP